jgi:Cof subfamily protein (haloacid dehalogenase superfamily)
MTIKLVALDIDGTLLNSKGEISYRNLEALGAARRQGLRIALVTGRRFRSARPIVDELGVSIPLISHNGALTKNVRTLSILGFHPLDPETARDVVRIGREMSADMICCDDPHGLGVMITEGISNENRALHRYLEKYKDSVLEVADLIDYIDHAPIQIMFSGACDGMDRLAERLKSAMNGRMQLFQTRYRSVDLTILDAISVDASKGAGLKRVADYYEIKPEEILAIGDNHNDLTMLRLAGKAVIMANAEHELKEMGFDITASNEEDGVAIALEKYVLNQKRVESIS